MTTPAPTITPRPATQFLNYPGDQRDGVSGLRPLGPNGMGELLWPVSAEYDPDQDRTRVGLSYVAPVAAS